MASAEFSEALAALEELAEDEMTAIMCAEALSWRCHRRLIADVLTPRQREVLIALAIDGVPTKDLARRLDTTTGALYKTLHDARRKLRASLVEA